MSDPQETKTLPQTVDPRKLATQGAHLQGLIPVEKLSRLSSAVLEPEGYAQVELHFSRDEQHRVIVQGNFELEVKLACQRCLQALTRKLEGQVQSGVVWDEDRATNLPKWLDPWLVSSDTADLYEWLEDEFLLAIPIVAYHKESQCDASGQYSTGEFVEEVKDNPFSILAKLKK